MIIFEFPFFWSVNSRTREKDVSVIENILFEILN